MSRGQRQRVAIARALYRNPQVLVFDEGTSALDNLTEAELIDELDRLRGERTMLIVAHRLTTLRRCDRIAVVSDGRIVDIGSYDDLLARSPEVLTACPLTVVPGPTAAWSARPAMLLLEPKDRKRGGAGGG